jgi:hypothetical protein
MKKVALFFVVLVAAALTVSGVRFAWRMVDANDWIDRCADETSGTYIVDKHVREEYCARTVESVSRDL